MMRGLKRKMVPLIASGNQPLEAGGVNQHGWGCPPPL